MDPYNEMLKGYNTDLHDDEIAQMTDKILYEGLRENCNEEVYRFLFGCIDLTSLTSLDSKESIWKMVESVNDYEGTRPDVPNVAAICVYPLFAETEISAEQFQVFIQPEGEPAFIFSHIRIDIRVDKYGKQESRDRKQERINKKFAHIRNMSE